MYPLPVSLFRRKQSSKCDQMFSDGMWHGVMCTEDALSQRGTFRGVTPSDHDKHLCRERNLMPSHKSSQRDCEAINWLTEKLLFSKIKCTFGGLDSVSQKMFAGFRIKMDFFKMIMSQMSSQTFTRLFTMFNPHNFFLLVAWFLKYINADCTWLVINTKAKMLVSPPFKKINPKWQQIYIKTV